ncbi:SDR family NAD(P)-dependent oxidoreductase [Marinilongibacter aquaticus]|uniref:SDR family NAD(P)-dependent oxidoreductase n=1 Tax=Marinilongibacter aquaticus TaxID=2975157 RepID=UPI0021BD9C0E|nr:SDR family NAD(P)-dependent oxidoreductase [Marinilongibacter aquaticus]UBM58654.1 SDR family NAD(P)-dependent oxidoreductase [Marinilongibacter aquaticus]
MKKVWFITGSNRGLGKSLTKAVLASGDTVVATARNPEQLAEFSKDYPEQLLTIALDVSNREQIHEAIGKAIAWPGRIDVLVNNAGFGITGAAEAFTDEQVNRQLIVNLWAPISITRAVLPYMRKQKSGRIIQISSIGGRVGNAGLSIYQAAKFGLAGFSESLKNEVAHLGISVTSVEPGGFRTDWAGSSMEFANDVPGYEDTVGQMNALFTSGEFLPIGDPDKAANALIEISRTPKPPTHLVLGSEAIAILKKADEARTEEMQKWIKLSLSTDHDEELSPQEKVNDYLKRRGLDF